METGNFYYLTDDYYQKFSDCGLMLGKESDENGKRGRPCYYCFKQDDLCWMIPISSKIEKYRKIYNEKCKKYRNYDGIIWGYVNGKERAFLVQNICPVTDNFVKDKYLIGGNPVTISLKVSKQLNAAARKAIRLYKDGKKQL